jgi:prolyl-tRNA editing enzyme YbaK/EbsC (Cys-tRNA(Pro) deacylase)
MPDQEPAAVIRFKEAHSARGGGGRVVILPDRVHTAALAAEALGCEVGAIANSLLFDTGEGPAPTGSTPPRPRSGSAYPA